MFKSLLRSLRNNTLLGIMLVTPIIATVWIFDFLFNLATAWLPATAFPELSAIWGGYALKLLTQAAVLVALFLFGLMTRNFFGRNLYILGDRIMTRIPLVKRIYNAVQKISVAVFAQRRTLFKEVVLVEYPRKGVYSLAFVTSELGPELSGPVTADRQPGEPCVNLFVATSPNPTSGLMIMLPRSQVHPLNLSITDAMTFIMSAGTVQPHDPSQPQRSLLERLEAGLAEPDSPRKPRRSSYPGPS